MEEVLSVAGNIRRGHGGALWEGPVGRSQNADDRVSKDGVDGVDKTYSSFMPSHQDEKSAFL